MADPTSVSVTEILGQAMVTYPPPPVVMGPPFVATFEVVHTNRWPLCLLNIKVGETLILVVQTEEPRVKALATWLLNESS